MGKNNEYLEISKQIVANIGGMDNIQGNSTLCNQTQDRIER